MSERAKKILIWMQKQTTPEFPIRQQTLAELFNCSRRTIGRALKELKEANLLTDLNRRHDNRCKVYRIETSRHGEEPKVTWPSMDCFNARAFRNDESRKPGLTPQGARQLELYRSTFEITFQTWPDWQKYYPQVTWELAAETDIHLLWRETFDKLYVIRDTQ